MHDDSLGSYGLRDVTLTDKPVFDFFFGQHPTRLSDYTFANVYIWRNAIHLRWQIINDCLCVFANGDGGLTMLLPPIPQAGSDRFQGALSTVVNICESYNNATRYAEPTRVEYISSDLIPAFPLRYPKQSMSGDYVYETRKMIDLDGGYLSSKRKSRNRFERLYSVRTEPFRAEHKDPCLDLLKTWSSQVESSSLRINGSSVCLKRAKETSATIEVITQAKELGLTGMTLYAGDQLVGFTFGEMLGPDTCSILIEKTDRNFKGSAQYIFSEFCRQYWQHTHWCNVGDDWDVPSLAWTKASYDPAFRLPKWTAITMGAVGKVA